MRPPVPYFGGKMTIGPTIVALLPAHRHYVEPYAGSLAVLLAKAPSDHETVNDLDQRLITFWRVLRERPEDLARVCALTPHSRLEFDAAVTLDAADDLELARQVFVRLTQGRSGQLRRTGWRNYIRPAGSNTSLPDYLVGYIDRIAPAAERLQRVSLEALPALEMVAKFGAEPDVLLYVDPPYLGSTRSKTWDGYEHEMRGEADHRALAAALHTARAAVVLSGYASPLYDLELYAGWDRHTITAGTGQSGTWNNRTEVLWSNRPLGATPTLFDTNTEMDVMTATLPAAALLMVAVPIAFPTEPTTHRCVREFTALDDNGRRAPLPKSTDYRTPKPRQGYLYTPACEPASTGRFYELTASTARARGAVPCTNQACFPEVNQ